MALVQCPLFDNPFYSYTIDLSGRTYTLTFRYSNRSLGYLMDIEDAEQNSILRGIQLVPLFGLMEPYSLENPPGEFILLPFEQTSFSNSGIANPRRLDQTHVLFYVDREGAEELLSGE